MKRTLFVGLCWIATAAWAHKPSDSYLSLDAGEGLTARWDLALRDLDQVLALDANGDGNLTWQEIRSQEKRLLSFASSGLVVQAADGTGCSPRYAPLRLARHSDGTYAVLEWKSACPAEKGVHVDYRAFFNVDPQHRGVVQIGAADRSATYVLSRDHHTLDVPVASTSAWAGFGGMVVSGVEHIWAGIDHLLFLLALLLPSVVRRDPVQGWVAVRGFKSVAADVFKIVTAFTVAHSLTLSASALGFVSLPSRLVESAIAASVVLAAANNIYPLLRENRWVAALALGLLHGFGFSSALSDLGLQGRALLVGLFGFNVGVELGQLACVLVFLPLAYFVRSSVFYRRVMLFGGSLAIVAIASVWFAERATLISPFPF
ncbi:MAG: HupE/UreJ family protein [Myxococcaceae bacterium]